MQGVIDDGADNGEQQAHGHNSGTEQRDEDAEAEQGDLLLDQVDKGKRSAMESDQQMQDHLELTEYIPRKSKSNLRKRRTKASSP